MGILAGDTMSPLPRTSASGGLTPRSSGGALSSDLGYGGAVLPPTRPYSRGVGVFDGEADNSTSHAAAAPRQTTSHLTRAGSRGLSWRGGAARRRCRRRCECRPRQRCAPPALLLCGTSTLAGSTAAGHTPAPRRHIT